MNKKILYIDLDGVVADFDKAINGHLSIMDIDKNFNDEESRCKVVDKICEDNPYFFHNLEPIEGSIDAVKKLFGLYDLYFLSTAMWWIPNSFTGKRIWIEKHFGELAIKRLILTHRKDLNIGHYLVDDRLKNGVVDFKGIHIHFGTEMFPNWEVTYDYLSRVANI